MKRYLFQRMRVFGSLVAICALTGCGESTGSVKGKVYLKDQLVTAGDVAFTGANQKVATSRINPDGSYEVKAVGAGLAKISVSAPMDVKVPAGMTMKPGAMGAADKVPVAAPTKVKALPIPAKYGDPAKSGLEFTVKSGTQEFDIKLP